MGKFTTSVFKKDQPKDNHKFQPLPEPSGSYPYHLELTSVRPVSGDQKIVFHMVGDTGSVLNPGFQQLVAIAMQGQFQQPDTTNEPMFLYHLGDLVYHHGEADRYDRQFFKPYQNYPAPIFAIAGNHDSDVNPEAAVPYKSLEAFKQVFCDTVSRPVAFSANGNRLSMIQPHIYWVLHTPLATIIGLHSNVPKYGIITEEQKEWFMEELTAAGQQRPDKAIIVCLHHAPYSADTNHGSSQPMIEFLEQAFRHTGVRPDIVFSGHVHNYQRFNKQYADGVVPYIVAGSGGFDELHTIASIDDEQYSNNSHLFNGVTLQSYCDTQHGFLRITLEKGTRGLILTGEYYTIPHQENTINPPDALLYDRFEIAI
ncbi:metallophosphoesterase family protein [Mucilaginibacter terrae]|uniref:metallophosphoesterase family protein n=1 Tax=Mucilaginibacter terrae TaxID=1955052 RepID=UPI0036411173